MLRHCNGRDRLLVDPSGRTGNCGRQFDDVTRAVICPHGPIRKNIEFPADRPAAFPVELRLIVRTGSAEQDIVTDQFVSVSFDGVRVTIVPGSWPMLSPMVPGGLFLDVHAIATPQQAAPVGELYGLVDHRGQLLAAAFADLEAGQLVAQEMAGALVALPIVADYRRGSGAPSPASEPLAGRILPFTPPYHLADATGSHWVHRSDPPELAADLIGEPEPRAFAISGSSPETFGEGIAQALGTSLDVVRAVAAEVDPGGELRLDSPNDYGRPEVHGVG